MITYFINSHDTQGSSVIAYDPSEYPDLYRLPAAELIDLMADYLMANLDDLSDYISKIKSYDEEYEG